MAKSYLLLLYTLGLCGSLAIAGKDGLQKQFPPGPRVGNFAFELQDPFVTENHEKCSVNSGCLTLLSEEQDSLTDNLGNHNRIQYTYETASGAQLVLSVREYDNGITIYRQYFITGLVGTDVQDKNGVSTGWPIFTVPSPSQAPEGLRVATPGGYMTGWTLYSQSEIATDGYNRFRDGEDGGIVLFTQRKEGYYESVVMSSLTEPMSVNVQLNRSSLSQLQWGIQGQAENIPAGFTIEVIVRESNHSTVENILEWGRSVQKYFNTEKDPDPSVDYLTYYTDNGASYYYNPAPYQNYEDLILAIHEYSTNNQIPFRYVQLDSWWYFKGTGDGVKNWTAMPSVFPNGIKKVYDETGWPIVAHNRYFSDDTDYAIQNGGIYDFFIDEYSGKSLPVEKAFWDDLFDEGLTWGLVTYEQDWLDRQYEGTSELHTNVTVGSLWLNSMGASAKERGITIQYCMSLTRQLVHSAQLPSVTQIRVSDDYILGNDQWRIGTSSLFAHALGLKPYKDVFWTSTINGNYYDCQKRGGDSLSYFGYTNHTADGSACVDWKDFGYDDKYPNDTMRLNLCHNPENARPNGAFCYKQASFDLPEAEWQWEYCDVPICDIDCYTFNGVNYEGTYNETESGDTCVPWNGDYGLEGSACRNPTNEDRPWCYINSDHTQRSFCNNYCPEITEVNPPLQSAISTLSTGPVGIGDRIENLNIPLIMKSCNTDGLLLKPSTPLLATDTSFFTDSGQLWTAQSVISNYTFGIIFVAETDSPFTDQSPLDMNLEEVLSTDTVQYKNYPVSLESLSTHTANTPITIEPCEGIKTFCLYYISPLIEVGTQNLTVLGELSKWAPISPQRIHTLLRQDDGLYLTVSGVQGEIVTIHFWSSSQGVYTVTCNFINSTIMTIDTVGNLCV